MKINDTITFEMICEYTGYIGIGISPSGNMANSDMMVAYIIGDQKIMQVIIMIYYINTDELTKIN